MEECSETSSIISLPDELITLIVLNNEPKDIISFGSTCKQFYEIVTKNEYLWKVKYTEIVPRKIVKCIQKKCGNGMLQEVKNVYNLKQTICKELLLMSPKFYSQVNQVSLEHVRNFFVLATESNISYYYTIYILQGIVHKGYNMLNKFECYDPLYSLTNIYYAKIVLCHLIHTFLSFKWVREFKRGNLSPQIVVTFFLQWIDCKQLHTDEDVDTKIQMLVTRVKNILNVVHPNRQGGNLKKYTEREVMQAITQAIYVQDNFSISEDVQLDNLNICKVIEEGNGITVVYGAIYQAVAKYFGIKCDLIAFSNHLFLEWQDNQQPNKPLYTIDLQTGLLKPKRTCPFSRNASYGYNAGSLIHYLFSMYMITKGTFRDCQTQNAIHILDFLSYHGSQNTHNPYKNFFQYLLESIDVQAINQPLEMEYLHDSQIQTILALSNLNAAQESITNTIVPKKHPPNVLYAVGMLCYHEVHNYLCIILGWELEGSKIIPPIEGSQPCYRVIAMNQSERYIAQEYLKPVTTPFRIMSFEEEIARDFTHFDGYTYVLNQEKKMEYPNEEEVIEVYKRKTVRATVPDVQE